MTMNTDWQNFLTTQSAHFSGDDLSHFLNAKSELTATANSTVLCALTQFGYLRVSGEEAQSFLQNLLSNDIRTIDATHAQLSSFNTAKGRMLAMLLIWRDGEDFILQLPTSILESLRKKLSMYVLRAKVKIVDASQDLLCMGLSGVDAAEILRTVCGELPREAMSCVQTATASILKISDTRYQITCHAEHAATLWTALAAHAAKVGSPCWDWLNIRDGIPSILPPTQEQFVPQMVNLDALGGINFKKGCYPGQEIVARMHYLGKLKRRMYVAHLDCAVAPLAGDELFSADMEGQASGMIANVAAAPAGGYDILAVIQTASVDLNPIQTVHGDTLQFLALPYALA
ncbi:MAG: folate-binding protein [Sideroxydans sp.]|nr:folate-binding protein [Sideroxydans sp.]